MAFRWHRAFWIALFSWSFWGGNLAAVVWQDHPFGETAPRALTRIPVTFQERSGTARKSAFSLSLPLPCGALFDTRQLRMCSADGEEIPLQSALLETWPDGSCKFLFLRGVLSLAAGEKKNCVLEFGSSILRSAVPGIVTASTREKILVDTGSIAVELSLRKFQLPEKITAGEKPCGRFLLPVSPAEAQVTVEETGHCSTLIALRNLKNDAVLRMRFFRELPLVALEYVPGGTEKFSLHYYPFSPAQKPLQAVLKEPGEILWLDLLRGELLPREAEYPVEGAISPDYLAGLGLFPEAYRPANEAMRNFADQWLARNRARRNTLPLKTLAALWFRTGEREDFLPLMEKLSEDRSKEADAIRKKIWLMTGINSCWRETVPAPTEKKTSLPAGTTAVVAKKTEAVFSANPPERNRLLSLLAHGFDPAAGSWKSSVDERGRFSGEEAPAELNLLCALLLMRGANAAGDPATGTLWADLSFSAIRRIFFDRSEMNDFSRMGEWFREAEIYLKNHPEKSFEFHDQEYWDDQCRLNKPTFSLKVTGKRRFSLVLRHAPAQLQLTRSPLASEIKARRCKVTDERGKEVFAFTTEREAWERKILLTGKPGECFDLILEDDDSGVWNLECDKNLLTMLCVEGNGVLFHDAQWKQFSFEIPPGMPALRLRFQPLSPQSSYRMQITGPNGEEAEMADLSETPLSPAEAPRKEIFSPAPGRWKIRFHVSRGDAFLAIDGKTPLFLQIDNADEAVVKK